MLNALLDLVAPARCAVCAGFLRLDEPGICSACNATWRPQTVEASIPFPCVAAAPFADAIRDAVHAWKFDGAVWRGHAFGRALAHTALDELPAFDIVVPAPVEPARLRQRGFNQAVGPARAVARRRGARLRIALRRQPAEGAQSTRGRAARHDAMTNAIDVARPVGGHRVLLVDDVVTTGATLRACSSALRAAGADVVGALTIAYTQRRFVPSPQRQSVTACGTAPHA